ncbi:MAG TPA: hypothetical protein VF472_12545 [Burkholderiaceae bacterium]
MTKQIVYSILSLGLMNLPSAASANSNPTSQSMKCEIGPVSKRFGETEWLVYSCSDGTSVVVTSAPGNPAMPFYFFLSLKDGKYQVTGEGNGNKDATKAAFNELSSLPASKITSLIVQTQSARR